jgi:hypothetical protein
MGRRGPLALRDQRVDRTVLRWLLLASLLAPPLGVPAAITFLGDTDPLRLWLDAGLESLFLLAPASLVGVWLGRRVDLGPKLLREFVQRAPGRAKRALAILPPSIGIGLLLALPLASGAGPGFVGPTTLEIFLRALSVSISEEVLFRLGLMTLFVWILRSTVSKSGLAGASVSIGNLLAALLFAAAHLPGNVTAETGDWNLVIGILLFNSFAGIALGWLYSRHGLLAAILAHFVADAMGYGIPSMF